MKNKKKTKKNPLIKIITIVSLVILSLGITSFSIYLTKTKQLNKTKADEMVFVGKITGRRFSCAYSELDREDPNKTNCFGGVAENPDQPSGFNQNCVWDPADSEPVPCPGVEDELSASEQTIETIPSPSSTIIPTAKHQITSLAIIGDSLSSSNQSYSYYRVLQNTLNIKTVDAYASKNAQTGDFTGIENNFIGMKTQLQKIIDSGIHYDWIIVFGGVNDLASGVSPSVTKNNLQDIYQKIHRLGTRVMAISILPWKDYVFGEDYVQPTKDINDWIAHQAVDVDLFINAYDYLNDPSNPAALKKQYDWGDGLHYNPAGQTALTNLILENLEK